jgi:hypothetical protein
MSSSIQIFVYNVKSGEIHGNNNFPLLYFSSREIFMQFLNELKYVENYDLVKDIPYFVINNPHYLPKEIQSTHSKLHIYYALNENLELLKKQNIQNNSYPNIGFKDYIEKL